MTAFQQILEFIRTLLSWFFTVSPWEQAIRIRGGSRVKLYGAGIYFKYPFFDVIYKQNVRKRISNISVQTLTTKDGKSLTLQGSLGYQISDIMKLHQTLHDGEESIRQEVLGLIANYVAENSLAMCAPAAINEHVNAGLHLECYGLANSEFFLNAYVANVRTFRLLQDALHPYNVSSNYLNTNAIDGAAKS